MKETEDDLILKGIMTGNRAVIKKFYFENFKYIRVYILQNSGSKEDVEDVFQDALVILYQKLEQDPLILHASLRTYFFAICKNLWKKRLRKKTRMIVTDDAIIDRLMLDQDILDAIEYKDQENLFRKYFLRLSGACQRLLNLVFEGKSMKEIAENTGYSDGYARKKKFECKKHLMEQIENDPIYEELVLTTKQD